MIAQADMVPNRLDAVSAKCFRPCFAANSLNFLANFLSIYLANVLGFAGT